MGPGRVTLPERAEVSSGAAAGGKREIRSTKSEESWHSERLQASSAAEGSADGRREERSGVGGDFGLRESRALLGSPRWIASYTSLR